jgi:hypothetical protein
MLQRAYYAILGFMKPAHAAENNIEANKLHYADEKKS